jgi:hypothetical protein
MVVIAAPGCFPILAIIRAFRVLRIDLAGAQRGGSPTDTRIYGFRFPKPVLHTIGQ